MEAFEVFVKVEKYLLKYSSLSRKIVYLYICRYYIKFVTRALP